MCKHAIIGANIIDRLVKCPGSLKLGKGSLASHDKSKKGYTQNRIENNPAVEYGLIIDELAKDYYRFKVGEPSKKMYHVKPEHELSKIYSEPAINYANHIVKIQKMFKNVLIDPLYDCSHYMKDIPNICEFRVQFNPDFVAMSYFEEGLAFVSDLSTAYNDDRNKMFQVICCAVGIIEKHPKITDCICEVYNVSTNDIMLTRLSRDELIAYKEDIILPALDRVRDAVQSEDIEEYRHYCSWCDKFCIFKDEGCKHCKDKDNCIENEVDIQLKFNTKDLDEETRQKANNLFKNNYK